MQPLVPVTDQLAQVRAGDVCPICLSEPVDAVALSPCGHIMCGACAAQHRQFSLARIGPALCPIDRSAVCMFVPVLLSADLRSYNDTWQRLRVVRQNVRQITADVTRVAVFQKLTSTPVFFICVLIAFVFFLANARDQSIVANVDVSSLLARRGCSVLDFLVAEDGVTVVGACPHTTDDRKTLVVAMHSESLDSTNDTKNCWTMIEVESIVATGARCVYVPHHRTFVEWVEDTGTSQAYYSEACANNFFHLTYNVFSSGTPFTRFFITKGVAHRIFRGLPQLTSSAIVRHNTFANTSFVAILAKDRLAIWHTKVTPDGPLRYEEVPFAPLAHADERIVSFDALIATTGTMFTCFVANAAPHVFSDGTTAAYIRSTSSNFFFRLRLQQVRRYVPRGSTCAISQRNASTDEPVIVVAFSSPYGDSVATFVVVGSTLHECEISKHELDDRCVVPHARKGLYFATPARYTIRRHHTAERNVRQIAAAVGCMYDLLVM